MRLYRHSRIREMAAALAVLALYALVLLTPLHQAAALQRDLAGLGYETVGAWSICGTPGEDRQGEDIPGPAKCPAAGFGKSDFAGLLSSGPALAAPLPLALPGPPAAASERHLGPPPHFGQSRAPPAHA